MSDLGPDLEDIEDPWNDHYPLPLGYQRPLPGKGTNNGNTAM